MADILQQDSIYGQYLVTQSDWRKVKGSREGQGKWRGRGKGGEGYGQGRWRGGVREGQGRWRGKRKGDGGGGTYLSLPSLPAIPSGTILVIKIPKFPSMQGLSTPPAMPMPIEPEGPFFQKTTMGNESEIT